MMPMPIDLRALTQSIVADMESSLEQREHTLAVKLPAGPVQVSADLGYLRMAIENVVHNASVYTPKGGRITIQLTRHGPTCTLSVSDSGVGIKKADLSKLFVKFSRIHNPLSVEAGGSGIGLYLTAEIVRLHGGSIDVVSRPGKGTTFALSLPVAQSEDDATIEETEN
jgi:two-component system phosphate regulon sensor histidine kinase PhoR